MAYDKNNLEVLALAAIEDNCLIFLSEVISYLPCSTSTFYSFKLEESEAIKKAIISNKITEKTKLRKKWRNTDNATLQIALYKLCSSDEELAILTKTKHEVTGKDGEKFAVAVSHNIIETNQSDEESDEIQ